MTDLKLETRETPFTQAEFASIPRNADGDITGDLEMIQIWMTPEQRDKVSEDDWSRIAEYQAEMEYMMNSLLEEFG